MIPKHLTKIIILFILVAFAPATVIGSSSSQESPKSVSFFSTGITTIPVFERPSGFFGDTSAQLATYTTSTQIAGSTYTGIFAGCCFLLSTEAGSCQDNPSCRPAYVTKTVSYYFKNSGPEAPSRTDPSSIIGNSTKTPAPGSSSGNGMAEVQPVQLEQAVLTFVPFFHPARVPLLGHLRPLPIPKSCLVAAFGAMEFQDYARLNPPASHRQELQQRKPQSRFQALPYPQLQTIVQAQVIVQDGGAWS
ncbi:hypothetical protein BHYA_0114g00280 [Botrytis hyacinthi]|uniref:Uncharacterized protein n=1 Tax=Botrytis hyacinthi TaxID=278943 RepID=A0A4Z1GIP9_9HELO|nr:hypothetical protein BHYA_0114g00280 [Botrytis hyacinthi]